MYVQQSDNIPRYANHPCCRERRSWLCSQRCSESCSSLCRWRCFDQRVWLCCPVLLRALPVALRSSLEALLDPKKSDMRMSRLVRCQASTLLGMASVPACAQHATVCSPHRATRSADLKQLVSTGVAGIITDVAIEFVARRRAVSTTGGRRAETPHNLPHQSRNQCHLLHFTPPPSTKHTSLHAHTPTSAPHRPFQAVAELVWVGVKCNNCKSEPIKGVRYKRKMTDRCEECYQQMTMEEHKKKYTRMDHDEFTEWSRKRVPPQVLPRTARTALAPVAQAYPKCSRMNCFAGCCGIVSRHRSAERRAGRRSSGRSE